MLLLTWEEWDEEQEGCPDQDEKEARIDQSSSEGAGGSSSSSSSTTSPSTSSSSLGSAHTSSRRSRRRLVLKDTFHTYVRPTLRPTLSTFCTTLTGVTQKDVSGKPDFVQALALLETWLRGHGCLQPLDEIEGSSELSSPLNDPQHRINCSKLSRDTVWCTHGPYDLRDFLEKQSWISGLHLGPPRWMRGPILDIRKAVFKWKMMQEAEEAEAKARDGKCRVPDGPSSDPVFRDGSIPALLADLGLEPFEGRLHCGLDDTRNLARLLIELARKALESSKSEHHGPLSKSPEKEGPAPAAGVRSASQEVESSEDGSQHLDPCSSLHQRPQADRNGLSQTPEPLIPTAPAAMRRLSTTPKQPRSAMTPGTALPCAPHRLLEPNLTLPEIPRLPVPHAGERASKSGSRYYPKRYAWFGNKVGKVKMDVGFGDAVARQEGPVVRGPRRP